MNGDLSWAKEHKTQQDEDFDRIAAERIARLRQRLDQYNEAIADATSSGKRAGSRPLPTSEPLAPPHLDPHANLQGSRPRPAAPAVDDRAAGARSTSEKSMPPSSMASTDFEIEMHPPSTRSHTQPSSAEPARESPSVRTRTTVRLDPQFEQVEDTEDARRSFGVVPPPSATTAANNAGARSGSKSQGRNPSDSSPAAELSEALPDHGKSAPEESSPPGRPSFVVHRASTDRSEPPPDIDEDNYEYDDEDEEDLDDTDADYDFRVEHGDYPEDVGDDPELAEDDDDDLDDDKSPNVPPPPPPPSQPAMTEEQYHAWERAVKCADEYIEAQNAIGPSCFEQVEKWLFTGRELKSQREGILREERLMQSREEETRIQIDEVLAKSQDIAATLRKLVDARADVDASHFAAWEEQINAKKAVADERMADLQRDIMLVDRRRAHINAMETHNDAKERAISQREASLMRTKRELDEQAKALDDAEREIAGKEDRVARWTDILDRREATIAAREAAMRRAQHAHDNATAAAAPPPPPRFREPVRGGPVGGDGVEASARFTTSRPLPPKERHERLFSPSAHPHRHSAREEIHLEDSPEPIAPGA